MAWLGRFLVAVCLAAAFNFEQILSQTLKAASRTQVVDGYVITVCYMGPPAAFYPRLLVFTAMLVAVVGIFEQTFPRSVMTLVGLTGALLTYIYWWMSSYRVFRNLSELEIDFLSNVEIKQAAYLYQGTWFDFSIAVSVVVCLVLFLDRLLNGERLAVP